MYGTEKMKNKIFRRFFSYYKNGATFGFRGRSIFFIFSNGSIISTLSYRTKCVDENRSTPL